MFYMVFAGQKRGGNHLEWSGPVGVFEASSAEAACQAAAKKVQFMGSYFAVEGFPWGIDLLESDAQEFGAEKELDRYEQLANRTRELERSVGIE